LQQVPYRDAVNFTEAAIEIRDQMPNPNYTFAETWLNNRIAGTTVIYATKLKHCYRHLSD
jgi:hypothetical protein